MNYRRAMGKARWALLVLAASGCGGDGGDGAGVDAGAEVCSSDADCPADAPICGTDSTCGPCSGVGFVEACSYYHDDAYCVDGGCAGCGEPGVSDYCAGIGYIVCGADGHCTGCDANEQCASGACADEECVAEEEVLYVEPGGSVTSDCTRAEPCGTIARAVELVASGRRVIALADGSYQEAVALTPATLPVPANVTLVGSSGVTIHRPTAGPVMRIRDADVRLERITLEGGSGASGHGIDCARVDAARAYVLASMTTIRDNAGAGILGSSCEVDVLLGRVADNGGDGISGDGAEASIYVTESVVEGNGGRGVAASGVFGILLFSSWVRGNGGGGVEADASIVLMGTSVIAGNGNLVDASVGGLSVSATSPEDESILDYLTIADNRAAGAVGGIRCANPLPLWSSIVAGNQGEPLQIDGCETTYTLVSGAFPAGEGNFSGDPAFVDPAAGDYDIGPDSDAIDRGDPEAGASRDIHGDRRGAGTMSDLGADEYVP